MWHLKSIFRVLVTSKLKFSYQIRRCILNLNPSIHIGKNTAIESDAKLLTVDKWGYGDISIGSNSYIGHGVQIIPAFKGVTIGDNSTINSFSVIYGQGGVKIGSGVRIAAHCVIVPSNHIFTNPDEYIYKQGMSCKGITIEDDVWIGAGVKVLDGCTISKGCVIGANAVVTKSTIPFGVYVGSPARLLKVRQ